MKKEFRKIVVLDNLILFANHKALLESLAEEVVYYKSSTPKTIKEFVRKKDRSSKGLQCATELGIETLAKEELARRVKGADCILTCWTGIPPSILKENPQLRYIGFWTHDKNKIGVPEAEARGVKVTYVPDYGTTAVAELVFAGALSLARDLRRHEKNTLQGKWPYEQFKKGAKSMYSNIDHEPTPSDIKEWTLKGKTIGIVGMGRIGKEVAKIAKYGFGMNVIYYSKKNLKELEFERKELRDVMRADIISIHLPPSAPKGMINKEMISLIKDGAIFVNTSVGHVVDQEVLLNELRTKRFNAFLEVFDGLPPRKELKEMSSSVLCTYRSGWYTKDSVVQKGDEFMKHLKDFVKESQNKPNQPHNS